MDIRGELLIGGGAAIRAGKPLYGIDAASGERVEPVSRAPRSTTWSAPGRPSRRIGGPIWTRARFLEAVADAIGEIGDALAVRCMAESGPARAHRGRVLSREAEFQSRTEALAAQLEHVQFVLVIDGSARAV